MHELMRVGAVGPTNSTFDVSVCCVKAYGVSVGPSSTPVSAAGTGESGLSGGSLSAHEMTMTGQFVGSLPRASPEQAKGASAKIDLRTDVYSLGAAATLVVLLLAFGITMSVMYGRAERQAGRAQRTLSFLQDTLFEVSSQRLGPDATLIDVLNEASRRIGTEFPDQPEIEAAVRYTIGHAYETIWKKEEAVRHLETSVELYSSTLGPDHPDTLRSAVHLGMVLGELRDPRSVELQRDALSRRRRQWEFAERLYHEALPLYRKHLGSEHADIARCLHAFANMKLALGRFEEAIPLYDESLRMFRKLLGKHRQFVPECMLGYANALQRAERYDEAEPLLVKSLEEMRQELADVSPATGGARKRLADLYQCWGKTD